MIITLSSLSLPLSSSSTASRELLSDEVDEGDLKWVKIKENCHTLVNQFHGIFNSKTPICHGCRKIRSVFRDVNLCFNASLGA